MKNKASKITSAPMRVERLPNGRRKLLRDLTVTAQEIEITVPEGFDTDYSSIPWFFAWVIKYSKVDVAGCVHDFLYRFKVNNTESENPQQFDRSKADLVWMEIAESGQHAANRVQSILGWSALRLFGWYVWNQYKKSENTSKQQDS